MRRILLLIVGLLLLVPSCIAQAPNTDSSTSACGNDSVEFLIRTGAKPPAMSPSPSDALVYFVEKDAGGSFAARTRFGLDGRWVGATHGSSWFEYSVKPGVHRICSDSHFRQVWSGKGEIAAAHFTAEAGARYYFEVKALSFGNQDVDISLTPLDSDQGQLLVSEYPFSSAHEKK